MLSDIHAALGLSQLEQLPAFVRKRNVIYQEYKRLLNENHYRLLPIPDYCTSSVHLCILQLITHSAQTHLSLFKFLRKLGYGVQLHYIPVHLHPYYRKLGFSPGDFPNSEHFSTVSISIPVFPSLESEQQSKLISILNSYF